jgi:hypothetical protein
VDRLLFWMTQASFIRFSGNRLLEMPARSNFAEFFWAIRRPRLGTILALLST